MTKIQRLSLTFIMVLIATVTWAHKIKVNNTGGNPTITVKNGDTTVGEATDVLAGSTITLTVADNDSKYLSAIEIQAFAGAGSANARRRAISIVGPVAVRTVTEYKVYEFTMPYYDVEITPTFSTRTSISDATINLVESSHVFDWLAHTPVISNVTISSGSVTLTEGVHYTVDAINSMTNVSSQTITIHGKGMYRGNATTTYSITQRSISEATIQLSKVNTVFTHINQKPVISGVYLNGQTMISGTDYTVTTNLDADNAYLNKGNYTITITGTGNFKGTASTTYTITQMPISTCTISGETSHLYDNTIWKPSLTINDGVSNLTVNTDFTISYSNSDSKEVGTYTLTITAKEGSNYSGSRDVTYYITSSGVTIENIADQTYTGSAIEPTIVVKDGSQTLTKGTHYDVVYSNNINVGLATVYAIGKGSYSFNQSKIFNIVPKSVSVNDITLTLSSASFTYNTNTQKPTVTVKDGNTTLKENVDYTLSNPGYVNVGDNYTATITGIGNYKDDKTSSAYAISQLDLTGADITLGSTNYVYDGTAKTPTVQQVKVGGVVIPSTDYTVGYTDNTSAGTATVTIRPFDIAPSNLSGTASTTFTISKKPVSDLTITLSATTFTYDGSEQKPTVTVKDGSTTLTESTHYTLTYSTGSTVVGSYFVTITGAGNYTGEIVKTYVINYGTSDADFTVTVSGTYTYNGAAYTPAGSVTEVTTQAVVVKNGNTILTPTTDYTLSYSNNINAGTATVTATGKGNYQFVQTGTFTIDPKPLTVTMVTFTPNTFVYNGSVQKPTVTVKDVAMTLVEGTDYTLTNNGTTNVSTGNTVTIVGKGNYTGTLDSNTASMPTYSITALDISSGSSNTVTITLYPLADATYSGIAKEPMVQQVKVNDIVFTSGYSVSYENNTNVGNSTTQPTVKVTGSGNLTGNATTTFVINPKPLTDDMVVLEYTSVAYDGTPKEPSVTVTDAALPTADKTVPASNYDVTYTAEHTSPGEKAATITGKGNYTGTISKPYTIVGASGVDIALSDPTATFTYNGSAHTPAVTVTKGSGASKVTLAYGTDYSVAYSDNIHAGTNTAYITVTGKGNYDFTQTKTFSIAKKEMTNAMVTLENNTFTYDGNLHKPTVTVSDGTPSIITSDDYTISNDGNINANAPGGSYTVTVTATSSGNYSGSGSQTYTISPLSISSGEVNLSYNNTVFNGNVQKPTVQTVYANGHQLTATTDYSISWPTSEYTNQGSKTVRVTGTGNYKDSKDAIYTIEQKEVTSNMIKITNENLTYTSAA